MKECLREEVIQSYLDGELQDQQSEQVAVHLATCSNCANLSRELEQENNLLSAALVPEFELAVPSEQLRQRIDTAIASERIQAAANHASGIRGWISSVSNLFAFNPQRAFAYSSLMVILGFGLIMALVRLQTTTTPLIGPQVAVAPTVEQPPVTASSPENNVAAASNVLANDTSKINRSISHRSRSIAPASVPRNSDQVVANHVKLLPGERSYLQTIAQLDSSINADKSRMTPEVQAEYQRNLAVVDRTLAVARTAAKSNPNDPDAAEFMFSAYQSKVDLLNTVAEARVFDKQP
ncbi:MAG TPA: zf-HC2 domain-containing protein [Pyrinomonadaceae bacterium]|nr:zf-HC2 domain-containing protein [Pyrinomonadaceae bacterium]